MSKALGPTFNVHTFSTVPYSPPDTSYPPTVQNSQFSWSISGPSTSARPITPTVSTNGVPAPPVVALPKKAPKQKPRTQEEIKITIQTAERFAIRLAKDQAAVLQPDIDTPFSDAEDAIRRLLPYHIYQQPQEDIDISGTCKGKQKETISDLKQELKETKLALECYSRYRKLGERIRKIRIRNASRSAPDDEAFIVAQAVLESDRLDASLLSNELKVARGELERVEREKRITTLPPPRPQYATTPTATTMQTQYYRPYPYVYAQSYGTQLPPTTSTFQVNSSTAAPYYRPTAAIPVQLPVASLPALHALGIHPVPASSITEGQAAPPAVLRGSTANGTMLTLEINVSLLQSAQMSGLAMVLNSLMSRTGTSITAPGPPSTAVHPPSATYTSASSPVIPPQDKSS